LIYWYQGFPQRYDESTREIVMKNSSRKSDYDKKCGNFRAEVHTIGDIDLCEIRSEASSNVLFWGDSQVQQLLPLIEKMHAEGKLSGKGVIFAIATGCPLTEHMNNVRKHFFCDTFAHLAMNLAKQDGIGTVFIGFSTWWALRDDELCLAANGRCLKKLPRREAIQYFLDELSNHIRTLRAGGKRVVVELPFPIYDRSIPDLEIHNAVFGHLGSDEVALDRSLPNVRTQIISLAKSAGADIFDPRESLCDHQKCIYQVDGVSIYADNAHIAASQIGILETGLLKVLNTSH
jgi:SGNH domain (fused to AT3 domains)